jgi:hypothetical protein
MGSFADGIAETLQKEFGGRTALGESRVRPMVP